MEIDVARTTCSFCPKLCRHECPAAIAEKTEVATPTFKQQVALLASAGRLALDETAARALYKCTGCLASRTPCRWEVEVEPSLRDARALAVRERVAPPEVAKVRERFRVRGAPYDLDLARSLAELALPRPEEGRKARVALLPACTQIARHQDEVRDAAAILDATRASGGEHAVVLSDPPCCGYPLDTLGLAPEFGDHARRVARSLAGHERIVATGAACAWTLSVRYAEVGAKLDARVVTLAEELAARGDAIRSLRRATPPAEGPFAYHDPCYLGRHLGKYHEPRAALAAATGEPAHELDRSREHAYCSGAGGGYALTHPGPSLEVARRALDAFKRTGARTLVTGCPSARRIFEKADPTVAVMSLAGAVARAIESPPAR